MSGTIELRAGYARELTMLGGQLTASLLGKRGLVLVLDGIGAYRQQPGF